MTGRELAQAAAAVIAVVLVVGGLSVGLYSPQGQNAVILGCALGVALVVITLSQPRRLGAAAPADEHDHPREFWWIGVAIPPGIATWTTFLYIAIRTRHYVWLAWSALYLSMVAAAVALNLLGKDEDPTLSGIAAALWLLVYAGGIFHAYLIRNDVRARLAMVNQPQLKADSEPSVRSSRPDRAAPSALKRSDTAILAAAMLYIAVLTAIGMPWFAALGLLAFAYVLRAVDQRRQ